MDADGGRLLGRSLARVSHVCARMREGSADADDDDAPYPRGARAREDRLGSAGEVLAVEVAMSVDEHGASSSIV
jgi:hypothetical protein